MKKYLILLLSLALFCGFQFKSTKAAAGFAIQEVHVGRANLLNLPHLVAISTNGNTVVTSSEIYARIINTRTKEEFQVDIGKNISSIAVDAKGEIVVIGGNGGRPTKIIYLAQPIEPAIPEAPPAYKND